MAKTSIEWATDVWNPTTGCDKVSPGCDNCYALTLAKRLKAMGSAKYQNDGNPSTSGPGFGLTVHPDSLTLALNWRKPRKIFVNSMSDLFHKDVPDAYIAQVFAVMALARQHTFQVLTKRHGRMRSLLGSEAFQRTVSVEIHRQKWAGDVEAPAWVWPLRNVWLGVSVEDQKRADLRIPALLETPAAVRWLSCEPLLGSLDLRRWVADVETNGIDEYRRLCQLHGVEDCTQRTGCMGVDWVIVGGESGSKARPMSPAWARSLRDQCQLAGVPFLFKQWGNWAPTGFQVIRSRPEHNSILVGDPDDRGFRPEMRRVSKHAAGRQLDGRTWDEYPEVAA